MPRSSFIALLGSWFVLTSLHAHDLHTSTGEAEFNPVTKKLEVSLTVFIDDLELALMRDSERLIRFGQTPDAILNEVIPGYLKKHFVLEQANGGASNLLWAGYEADEASRKSDGPLVTLFFELSVTAEPQDALLKHDVLQELFRDQENLLHLKVGGTSQQRRFNREKSVQPLR